MRTASRTAVRAWRCWEAGGEASTTGSTTKASASTWWWTFRRGKKHGRRVDDQGMTIDRVTGERVPAFKGEELSGKQLRFATRVHVKLGECLVHNVQVKERLLDNTGFTVLEVRMSPDLQKAYIRWSCRDGREAEADKAVRSATAKLRQCLSKSLGAKFVPSLEFRREGERNPKQEALEDAFRRASEEREAWEKEGRVLDGHAKDEKNDG